MITKNTFQDICFHIDFTMIKINFKLYHIYRFLICCYLLCLNQSLPCTESLYNMTCFVTELYSYLC